MSADYDMSIHNNPSALAWAEFFVATMAKLGQPCPDVDTMLGWFANAMMAMHDFDAKKASEEDAGARARALGEAAAYVRSQEGTFQGPGGPDRKVDAALRMIADGIAGIPSHERVDRERSRWKRIVDEYATPGRDAATPAKGDGK